VPLDAIVVEVVEDGQAVLVAVAVVRLGAAPTASVRPVDGADWGAIRPAEGAEPVLHAAGPDVLLALSLQHAADEGVLAAGVDVDGVPALA